MMEEGYVFKIDPEFRRLVLPYNPEEYSVLEQEILQNGCQQPVIVWYGYIIQGFEQYEICKTHGIAFEIKNISFRVREEVISITCREQLSTRYLPENQYRYLIGKRCNADIIVGAHNAAGTDQFKERASRELSRGKNLYESSTGRTKQRLAQEYQVNQSSITRYSIFAQAIDYIASLKPETADLILAGKMKISIEAVMACHGKTEDEVIKQLSMLRKRTRAKKTSIKKEEIVESKTIKDMPDFDPDAEINSLALTVPSWISSIKRTHSTANFSLATIEGRSQLERELYQLQKAIEIMLHALKEVR